MLPNDYPAIAIWHLSFTSMLFTVNIILKQSALKSSKKDEDWMKLCRENEKAVLSWVYFF